MEPIMVVAIVLSEAVALVLMVRTWLKPDYVIMKVLLSVILVVPIIGPFLYFFANDRTPPQNGCLKNNLPRGWYTDRWISMRPLYKKVLAEKTREKDDSKGYKNKERFKTAILFNLGGLDLYPKKVIHLNWGRPLNILKDA